MIRRRKDRAQRDEVPEEVDAAAPSVDVPSEDVDADSVGTGAGASPGRTSGPWDSADFTGDDSRYVDLGPLRIRGRVGFQLQVPQDEGGATGSVVLVTEDAGLELRAFAAPRSGGLWDEVRADLLAEVERLKGEVEQVDGPFGPELRVRIPVTLPDGQAGFQPSRILAVEGPRWMLRATFLGAAALEPDEDGLLEQAFREVVVVRGDGPMLVREPLLISVPEGTRPAAPADLVAPDLVGSAGSAPAPGDSEGEDADGEGGPGSAAPGSGTSAD